MHAYIHTVNDAGGTLIFADNSTHNCWVSTLGILMCVDQPTTGLIDVGSYASFNKTLSNTYAPLNGYTALSADYNTFKNTTVPSSYLLNSTASSTYLTQNTAASTYRKISDSYSKTETLSSTQIISQYLKMRLLWAGSMTNLSNTFWAYPYTNMPNQVVITGTINSSGYYTVTHNLATAGVPDYMVMITTTGIDNKVYHAPIIKNNNNFVIKFYSDSGVATDQMFDCMIFTWY